MSKKTMAVVVTGFLALGACDSGSEEPTSTTTATSTSATGSGSGAGSGAAQGGAGSGTAQGGNAAIGVGVGSASGGSDNCGNVLDATIRDFQQAHPDFQAFAGSTAFTGIVEDTLGSDNKPVYAHAGGTAQTTGPNEFAQWYNDVSGVNETITVGLMLAPSANGVSVFDDSTFFPIDGMGFGNEGNANNFHFTTEIHVSFEYKGGEIFTFTGDDDLWLFINGRLAIDLGGLHPQLSDTIDLDAMSGALGIQVGQNYPMDIFHAERRTSASNFRIETTIDCFEPQPPL